MANAMTRRVSVGLIAAAIGTLASTAPAANAQIVRECTIVPGKTITKQIGRFYPPRTITITTPDRKVCRFVRV